MMEAEISAEVECWVGPARVRPGCDASQEVSQRGWETRVGEIECSRSRGPGVFRVSDAAAL